MLSWCGTSLTPARLSLSPSLAAGSLLFSLFLPPASLRLVPHRCFCLYLSAFSVKPLSPANIDRTPKSHQRSFLCPLCSIFQTIQPPSAVHEKQTREPISSALSGPDFPFNSVDIVSLRNTCSRGAIQHPLLRLIVHATSAEERVASGKGRPQVGGCSIWRLMSLGSVADMMHMWSWELVPSYRALQSFLSPLSSPKCIPTVVSPISAFPQPGFNTAQIVA